MLPGWSHISDSENLGLRERYCYGPDPGPFSLPVVSKKHLQAKTPGLGQSSGWALPQPPKPLLLFLMAQGFPLPTFLGLQSLCLVLGNEIGG